MCNRYKLDADPRQLRESYQAEWTIYTIVTFENVAYPRSEMPVLVLNPLNNQRTFYSGHWGIYPPQIDGQWDEMKKFLNKYATHNARSETVSTSKLYSKVWGNGQRCIIPVTAFNEWTGEKGKRKILDFSGESKFLSLAGIYSGDMKRIGANCSYSMLTTEPNALVNTVHDRMPVVIDDVEKWLSPKVTPDEALKMCVPFSGELKLAP